MLKAVGADYENKVYKSGDAKNPIWPSWLEKQNPSLGRAPVMPTTATVIAESGAICD